MRFLVESVLHKMGARSSVPFAVRFAGGGEYRNRAEPPVFTLVFRSAAAYARIAAFGHVGLLESYFDGDLDVEGDLAAAMAAGLEGGVAGVNPLVGVRNRWHELRFSNRNWAQAKKNAEFHYALGTEFYRYWLDDPLMMYTCAYWKEGTRTLEEAQRNKIEHVARKLRLAPGESAVDIGSGFGGFMFHAHEKFGVNVAGINTTTSQVEMVRAEIARRGLERSLEVIDTDFRDARRQYDKVVSIGTLEHAGRDQLDEVVRAHAAFLKPGGLGMLHFIGHVGHFQTEFFIRRHIFPGGWIPSLAHTLAAMERAGLEVLDVENLRRHYALTLDAWGERFDRNWEKIRALDPKRFDERFRRVWRAYLYGCAEMFRSAKGYTHLFQIVFSKGNATRQSYPMSREFLYEQRAHREDAGAQRAA
ncbi:MAG: cyclopropane-fatty-acyl-phospholipid synthase family protein [Betaproteobacteria bacterium]|nr:cyclopropane-fatty-acyl-phospholipid synthase family protein [Betaproteobacteria bacterium]